MKKIKKILIILSLILVVTLTIILLPKDNNILKTNDNSRILNNKNIALMLEQDDGKYNESTSNTWPDKESYIFNPNLSKCDKGGKLSYDESKNIVNVKSTKTEKCYLYFDEYTFENHCNYSDDNSLACNVFRAKDDTLIYHNGSIKSGDTIIDAQDLSYRFAGSDEIVNNNVCLGTNNSETGVCSNEDLYRIIGLFKNGNKYEVKLIKNTPYVGNDAENTSGTASGKGYRWSGSAQNQKNTWKDSILNTSILNINYLQSLPSYIQSKIIMHSYITGGTIQSNIHNKYIYEIYQNEIKNPILGDFATTEDKTYNGKIGLMYISDYGYSAYEDAWTVIINEYVNKNIQDNNWLFINDNKTTEWLITRYSDNGYAKLVFRVQFDGYINSYDTSYVYSDICAVRPVFYLDAKTMLKSGDGTKNNPYRIS